MGDVGSGEWCFDLVRDERRSVMRQLRKVTSYMAGFPDPRDLASAMSLRVEDVPSLPCPVEQLTDGRTLWVVADPDQRVRGTRMFRGIASAVLGIDGSVRSATWVEVLAGRLAAPPLLVSQLGLAEAVKRQRWATEQFVTWCWASRLP